MIITLQFNSDTQMQEVHIVDSYPSSGAAVDITFSTPNVVVLTARDDQKFLMASGQGFGFFTDSRGDTWMKRVL